MLFKHALVVGALLAVSVPSVAKAEEAPPSGNEAVTLAQSFADKAYAAYERHEWSKAIALYLESYRLAPASAALFNVASIYDKKLNDGELALSYYRRFCASVDAAPDLVIKATDRISEIERAMKAAQDARTQESPKPATTAPPASEPAASSNSGSTLRTLGYVSIGLGAAALAAGSVFGLSALSQHNDAEQAGCKGASCTTNQGLEYEEKAFDSATKSTIFFIASGALVSTGVAFLLFAPSSRESQVASVRSPTLKLSPVVAPESAGLVLSGSMF